MARIDELKFGSIVIDGKKYRKDILILADGTVKKRKGGFLMFGNHEIKREELEGLGRGQPEIMVVGTGTDGAAHVGAEAESWAKANNVNLVVQPSYDAVAKLNELAEQKRRVAALIHITC